MAAIVPTNRIRSFTRWPQDRAARIEAAKIEIASMRFLLNLNLMELGGVAPTGRPSERFDNETIRLAVGMLPAEVRRRADAAAVVLNVDRVPMEEWGA